MVQPFVLTRLLTICVNQSSHNLHVHNFLGYCLAVWRRRECNQWAQYYAIFKDLFTCVLFIPGSWIVRYLNFLNHYLKSKDLPHIIVNKILCLCSTLFTRLGGIQKAAPTLLYRWIDSLTVSLLQTCLFSMSYLLFR